MRNLKNKFLVLYSFLICVIGCQTVKVFEMKPDVAQELNVISIDSNRVVQECYFLNAEKENKWRHMYLLHMLNQYNEVITASYPITLDKQACTENLRKIDKIVKKDSKVRLCVREILKKDNSKDFTPDIVDFGPLGKHPSPYDFLTFDTICNSKDCVSISETWTYTCPGFNKISK